MVRPLHPTALVTGANRGIGRAIAAGLKARGCQVTLSARVEAQGRAAAAELGVAFARIDLADPDTLFDTIAQTGGFDILVNNAGVLNDISLLDRRSDFAEAMEVMVHAPLDLIRLNVPHWRDTGWGRIVNMSSIARYGNRGQSNYSAAKAALAANTLTWAREFGAYGIRVGAIAPGMIETPMTQGMNQKARDALVEKVPAGRVGLPEDIWQGVRFVLECDYFTGRTIDIDGGLSM